MKLFGFLKTRDKSEDVAFDPTCFVPAVRSSICTGEKSAGFKEIATGRFIECDLVKSERDLAAFAKRYGIDRSKIREEW